MTKRKKAVFSVSDLIEQLEGFDPDLPISVFRADGDYGTPSPTLVTKRGHDQRVVIVAKEDD